MFIYFFKNYYKIIISLLIISNKKMKSSSLTNISSVHTIKLIFSHLEYNRFFSLIKYNKEIQQNLKINFKENIFPNNYIERLSQNGLSNDYSDGLAFIYGMIIYGVIYIFFFLHYLLNVILTINLNPKLYKNNDSYWETINGNLVKKFSILFHFFALFVLCHVLKHFSYEYIGAHKIFVLFLALIIFAHGWYEIALFHKIKLIYSFALNGKWMIFFDVILIILNFIHVIVSGLCLYQYIFLIKTVPEFVKIFFLNLYKGISIYEYRIYEDFNEYSERKRQKVISENANFYKINYSKNDLDLIKHINEYRLKKNLNEFIRNDDIPNFIIKGSTEIFLSSNNIIKLSNIKYVLRFNKNHIDFENLLNNKDIMEILNNPFFNKINIVQQSENKYITIYEEFDGKNYDVISIRDNNGNENSILKTNVSD